MKKQCTILAGSLAITGAIAITGFTLSCGIAGVAFYMWFVYTSIRNPTEESKEHDEELGENFILLSVNS